MLLCQALLNLKQDLDHRDPQNLYLYNLSGMNIGEFVLVMLPYTGISLALLLVSILLLKGKREAVVVSNKAESALDMKKILVYLMLFVLAFLVVLKVLPFEVVLGITLVVVFFMERKVLKDVDYCLLLTFISFFVFTGNMGNIPVIKNALQQLVEGREVLIGVLSSQAISNVPAAMLLSGFTRDYKALIYGVDIGGLGTLIASLASLISYKYFSVVPGANKGKYLKEFTLWNLLFLAVLLPVAFLLL